MANQSVKLTKRVVDAAPAPAAGQTFLRDAELKGFALRVTAAGVRTFIFEKRIDGRVRRVTLGRYGELTVEQARKEAQRHLGTIATGGNPIADRERARLRSVTLAQAFEDFKRARANLSPRTIYDYTQYLSSPLGDWRDRQLHTITKDMVADRHAELGAKSGQYYANSTMRVLRSLFNFAIANYEDSYGHSAFTENPVSRLTRTRAWFREQRRQTVLKRHQLPAWYRAVETLRSDPAPVAATVADYLEFLVFTGLRRSEAAELSWRDVDLANRTLTVPDPKNHVPHTLPLPDHIVEMLRRRQDETPNGYVFPGQGRQGFLIEPKRQIAKVIAQSGVQFAIHDLRRTFITVAESLDISPYTIKRLVNHKMRNDVTAGYIVSDLERLREPMRKIERFLLQAVELTPPAKVINLRGTTSAAQRPLISG
jgi:integrase